MTERTAAVIIHWGDPAPSLRLARAVRAAFDDVLIVANDGQAPPHDVPENVTWLPSRNVGYAGACTLGVATLPGRSSYAFLNNDVEITAAACLSLLRFLHDDRELAVVGPVLLHADGRLQSGAGSWSPVVCAPLVRGAATGLQRCSWVTGAAFFCRGQAVRDLGFDEAYFLGQEDADFCDRAAAAGWGVAVAGHVTAVHDGRTTISGSRWQYYSLRNRLWFVRRRRSRARVAVLVMWASCVLVPLTLAADLVRRRPLLRTKLALHAVVDGLRPMPPADRCWPDEPRPARWMTW